ncbi:hypothetical protein [Coleofasciculus sp. FACHB-1120]|uniref:hypothetical protein n=1 Tax=Coleofasciculus sp. FACHB-1120 TaxID=2692783 RepID=UPI0016835478|nr:hypothetical protein [Coleofasciculus sp. FACHB-1120]MBD2743000.1 hypothetical protein [Coleofasciculus sp. FACHB-1120]
MNIHQEKLLFSASPPAAQQLHSRQQLRLYLAQEYQKAQQLRADGAKERQKSQQLLANLPKTRQKLQQLLANSAEKCQKSQQLCANSNRSVPVELLDIDLDIDLDERLPAIELPLDSLEYFDALVQAQSDVETRLQMIDRLQLDLVESLRSLENSLEELSLDLGKCPLKEEQLIENQQLDTLDRDISQEAPDRLEGEKIIKAIDKFLAQYLSGDGSGNNASIASDTL